MITLHKDNPSFPQSFHTSTRNQCSGQIEQLTIVIPIENLI